MPHVVHNVFFSLHDSSPESCQRQVAACDKYLKGHDGVVYYSAGVLCPSLARPVNDRGFDVALHVVFDSMASHDAYQAHPRHQQFITESKPGWKQVRVFDSEVTGG
ncbi:MAG: Dabb family protein [Planctomycetaceae bacterium]